MQRIIFLLFCFVLPSVVRSASEIAEGIFQSTSLFSPNPIRYLLFNSISKTQENIFLFGACSGPNLGVQLHMLNLILFLFDLPL